MTKYKLFDLKINGDERGSLVSIEQDINCPFKIKRVYYIFDTKKGVARGFHAHVDLKQIVLAVKGSCNFIVDNGKKKEEIKLSKPNKGLLIEGLVWREMRNFSPDCVLLVLASENYIEKDYIKDYNKFLELVKNDT